MSTDTGRFAPSPTGRMHLGNVFSALLSWLSVKSKGGRWLLRIEDIDPQRSRQEYADLLMADLEWLGLTWDGTPVYQSRRGDLYEAALERLRGKGLLYPCFCTRADILATQAPHESDGRVVYKGTCRRYLTQPAPEGAAALRVMVPPYDGAIYNKETSLHGEASRGNYCLDFLDGHYGSRSVDLTAQVGDFIVRRKDGAWAYQLAVVVDDAEMGVTEVVRGRDLLLSSPQQMYLAGLLDLPSPQFIHLPLLCNGAGQRLSKRDKSLDMGVLRQTYTAEEIIGFLAHAAGLTPDAAPVSAAELLGAFDWQRVPCSDITVSVS